MIRKTLGLLKRLVKGDQAQTKSDSTPAAETKGSHHRRERPPRPAGEPPVAHGRKRSSEAAPPPAETAASAPAVETAPPRRPPREARAPREDRPPREDRGGRSGRGRGRGRRAEYGDEGTAPSAAHPTPPVEVPTPTLPDRPLPENGFATLGLPPAVRYAIEDAGYQEPTPIQAQAIPLLMEGKDLIGGSQTGTGKTAAFALPILAKLERTGVPRALILEPTRELATQVEQSFIKYGKYLPLRDALLYGGVGYGRQREQLREGADIVVATPGRMLDHIEQGALRLDTIEILVLDEADRMLDMGFLPDVHKIVRMCKHRKQNLLFSATIPPAIEKLAKIMLTDPVQIKIGSGTAPAETISHAIYPVDERQKFDLLLALLEHLDYRSVLIFSRTKHGADIIARWLENHGHEKVAILHSDRTQAEREEALADFKSGRSEILVATDLVSRGLDISGVSHVINYDIPQHCEDYVHRIGRTGRAQREGDAVTLYTAGEQDFLRSIERFIGREIERKRLETFDYRWSPILEEKKPGRKKRNR